MTPTTLRSHHEPSLHCRGLGSHRYANALKAAAWVVMDAAQVTAEEKVVADPAI
jgi:hypothetical protein